MIVIINPNSTETMTDAMVDIARSTTPDVAIEGWTSHHGPPVIQGPKDGEASIPPLLKLVRLAAAKGAKVIIIGCFDDTGLPQARKIAACPVIGIGQAAYHIAALAGERFSVVTTLDVSVPVLESNIQSYGLAGHLSKVRASGVPVLDLETDPETANPKVIAEINRAASEDRVHSVVLGCAGMVGIPAIFGEDSPVRLVDGVVAATKIARILI